MIINIAQKRDRGHLCVCIKNLIIRKKEGRHIILHKNKGGKNFEKENL